MRKVFVALGLIGICLIITAAVFLARFDVTRYRPQIEAMLQERFGRDVHLGDMSVSFFPPGFRANNAVISEDPVFGNQAFATIDTLYIRPRLIPLLHRSLQISSLELGHPNLEIVRNEKGVWNFASLLQGRSLAMRRLKISDGQVAITDQLAREPRAIYDHIDVSLYDYSPNKSFPVDARLHMPGAGEQVIAFDGDAGPIQREALGRTPLDGKLELNNVALSSIQRFLKADVLVNSDAVLTGKSDIRNDGTLFAKGRLEIRDARIRGVDMGYPITADYDVSSNTDDRIVSLRRMDLKLDRTPVSVEGTINSATSPATLDLHVRTPDGSIAEVARLSAALGIAFNANQDVSGRLAFDLRAKGPASTPVVDGKISAKNIRVRGEDVKSPVEVSALDLMFSPDSIRSNEFVAKTGHTNVTAQVTIESYASPSPQLRAAVNTGKAELGELIGIARAYGAKGEPGLAGSGSVVLNVGVSGPLKQPSQWSYTGNGAISDAELRVPSLGGKPLQVQKANLRFTSNSLVVDNLAFTIGETTARGNLTAYDLSAPRVDFSLSADKINAAEWHDMAKPRATTNASTRSSLLARATGSGQLAAQTVVYDQLVLTNVRSTVKLDHGIITMNPITAGLYNGQEVGSIAFNVTTQPVTYTVNSKLQNIDANLLLSSISSLKNTLYGVMSASTNGRFAANGSANNIARSLNGRVSLNLAEGKLANMDLVHQLATIGKFLRTARAVEPFTRLIRMNGDFDITNGVARTNNLEAVIEDGSLAADGTIDLADQKLNVRLTAVLSQDYSQTVGGTRIAGLMSTVLPNQRGEFVIPILLSGTLNNPKFAPDFEMIARMKLRNLVPTLGRPDQLTSAILGGILGAPRTGEQAPPEQARPEDLLRNIFEGVFGARN